MTMYAQATNKMPIDVAVEEPHARVVGHKTHSEITVHPAAAAAA